MTDNYSTCETALAVLLRTLGTGFFPGDVQRDAGWQVSDDDTVLSYGGDYFIVYRPGACPVTPVARGIKEYYWEVLMDLYIRYVSYKDSWTKFKAFRAAIITLLDTHQSLSSATGVRGVVFTSDERPLYFRFNNTPETAKPNFIIQQTKVVIRQQVLYVTGDL